MGAKFFQADGQTDTIKLIVAICNFENASMCLKNVLQQQQQADIAFYLLGGTGAMSPADTTYW